jgi:hypothetical protein
MRYKKSHLMSHFVGTIPVVGVLHSAHGTWVRLTPGQDPEFRFGFTYREEDSSSDCDPYAARDAFMRIRTSEEALILFRAYGVFDERESVTFSEVMRWRGFLEQMQLCDVNSWRSLREPQLAPTQRSRTHTQRMVGRVLKPPALRIPLPHGDDPLTAYVDCGSVLEAAVLCLYLDKLQGVQSLRCERPDCRAIFMKSHARQKYCSPECGHKQAVRSSRKRMAANS